MQLSPPPRCYNKGSPAQWKTFQGLLYPEYKKARETESRAELQVISWALGSLGRCPGSVYMSPVTPGYSYMWGLQSKWVQTCG